MFDHTAMILRLIVALEIAMKHVLVAAFLLDPAVYEFTMAIPQSDHV